MTTHLKAYLDALPQGVGSYPTYVQKASIYRQFLDLTPMAGVTEVLPEAVRHLVTDPAPVSAWIPEVHLTALYLATLDVRYADETAYVEHWGEVNRALLQGRLYRLLMRVASPSIVIRGAVSRWRSFHRGVALHLDRVSRGNVVVRMTCPPGLIPAVLAPSYALAFQAALEVAGADEAVVRVEARTDTEIRFTGRWR